MVYACGLGKLGLIFTVYRKVFEFSFINLHHEKLEKRSVLLREHVRISLLTTPASTTAHLAGYLLNVTAFPHGSEHLTAPFHVGFLRHTPAFFFWKNKRVIRYVSCGRAAVVQHHLRCSSIIIILLTNTMKVGKLQLFPQALRSFISWCFGDIFR